MVCANMPKSLRCRTPLYRQPACALWCPSQMSSCPVNCHSSPKHREEDISLSLFYVECQHVKTQPFQTTLATITSPLTSILLQVCACIFWNLTGNRLPSKSIFFILCLKLWVEKNPLQEVRANHHAAISAYDGDDLWGLLEVLVGRKASGKVLTELFVFKGLAGCVRAGCVPFCGLQVWGQFDGDLGGRRRLWEN